MQKTKKSIAKRFKITASGKMMRRSPGARHLMRRKGTKQLRKKGQDQAVYPAMAARLKMGLPHA